MFWKLTFISALAAITLAGFWQTPIPYTEPPVDKFAHALGFAALSFCMFRALNWPLWCSVLQLILMGAAIELGQEWFLPLRTFSVEDLLADGIGIAIGLISELIWRRLLMLRNKKGLTISK